MSKQESFRRPSIVELDEIKQRFSSNQLRLSEALTMALPKFRGLASDELLVWGANEIQGYSDGLSYYQPHPHQLPAYRVVSGALLLVMPDGSFNEINHPLAQRGQYFLSAPVQWLEDFASVAGHSAIVDLPELTNYIGRLMGGTIVCETHKDQLMGILGHSRDAFLQALDHVIQIRNQKAGNKVQGAWVDMPDFSAPPPEPPQQSPPVVPPAAGQESAPSQTSPQWGAPPKASNPPAPSATPSWDMPANQQATASSSGNLNVVSPPNQLKPPAPAPGVSPPSLIKPPAAAPKPRVVSGQQAEPTSFFKKAEPQSGGGAAPQPVAARRQDGGGAMDIKKRTKQLMMQAYGTKDKVLALESLKEQAERDVIVDYLLRMRFVKELKQAGVYSLTKEGIKEVEQYL